MIFVVLLTLRSPGAHSRAYAARILLIFIKVLIESTNNNNVENWLLGKRALDYIIYGIRFVIHGPLIYLLNLLL